MMRRRGPIVLILLVLVTPRVVLAASENYRTDAALSQSSTWELVDADWVLTTDVLWRSSGYSEGDCNGSCGRIQLQTYVSVAEWVDWDASHSRNDWVDLRPGTYRTKAFGVNVRSNNALHVRIDDAEVSVPGEEEWYSQWLDVPSFPVDGLTAVLPAGSGLLDGINLDVWEQIDTSSGSGPFHGIRTVLVCVSNVQHWVDSTHAALTTDMIAEL